MIEGYLIEGKRFLRGDERHYNITSDIVFTSLSDAIEEGRKTFRKYFDILVNRAVIYDEYPSPIDERGYSENSFDENNMRFYAHEVDDHYVEVTIRKVSIKLGNKKLEETNND